jgi:hypothetical protein
MIKGRSVSTAWSTSLLGMVLKISTPSTMIATTCSWGLIVPFSFFPFPLSFTFFFV